MTDGDLKIRAAFQRQREEESRQTPRFQRIPWGVPSTPRPNPRWIPVLVASGALAAAAVLALFIVSDRDPQPVPEDLAFETWRAPTDFLLLIPGSGNLGSLPSFGSGSPAPVPLNADVPTPSPERSRS